MAIRPRGEGEGLEVGSWMVSPQVSPRKSSASSQTRVEVSLVELESEAVARLFRLDGTRWGRHRYAPVGDEPPPLAHATHPERVLEALERLLEADPTARAVTASAVSAPGSAYETGLAGLSRCLLHGLAAGYGTCDLHNEERRLGTHHLSLIIRRYQSAYQEAARPLGLEIQMVAGGATAADRGASSEAHPQPFAPGFRRLGRRSFHVPTLKPHLRMRLAHVWSVYRTYLDLRAEAELLTGSPQDESFQGVARSEGTQRDALKAHLWYELADVLFLGIVHRLMRLSLARLQRTLRAAEQSLSALEELLEYSVLARTFGEGRSHQRIRALVSAQLAPGVFEQFEALSQRLTGCIEKEFRQSFDLQSLDVAALENQLLTLWQSWKPKQVSDEDDVLALEWHTRVARQDALRNAECWLERVSAERLARRAEAGATPGGSRAEAWRGLTDALESVRQQLQASAPQMSAIQRALQALRQAVERASDQMLSEAEFLHWPGDGEDYRTRRQRASAPGDRFAYLMAMGERMLMAAAQVLGPTDAQELAPQVLAARILTTLERDPGCIFLEEWVAHYGPRLETIFGLPPRDLTLPGNQKIQAIDRQVRRCVGMARARGGAPEHWGWLFCGVTERLRELLRRHGVESAFATRLEILLESQAISDAEAFILTQPCPGAESADFDAYVTVGVHVFNADCRIVRENLLHNRQLFWAPERLWLLLGSSSANRSIAAQEREICLESGVTHYFITARRHQKAGNQNRVIPNIPAHPAGKTFYLTLDDDYLTSSQTLPRLVALAERHPDAAFVQLPLYLFGNHLLGVSRARLADASGMVVWGSLTSLGLRDLRIFPDTFANRRTLALPFGTCTLFRLTPERNSLDATGGMYTDTVCEDFAQGLLAFSLKHVHYPRPPSSRWDDGILLNEVWIEGDGVELFGRIRQQSRWCEGSVRNGLTIWIPAALRHLRQRFGLEPLPDSRPPSLAQLFGGTVMVLGYVLEVLGMILFMVGFPLTSIIAEYSDTLGHTLKFWMGLWGLHLLYSYYLAVHCGLSLKTFLDQHFIRFASIMGLLEGLYNSLRSPTNQWAACKDARVQINVRIGGVYLGVALLNILGAAVGAAKGMTIYYLCLITAVTAVWAFQLKSASPIHILERIQHLPQRLSVPWLAWWAFRREGRRPEHVLEQPRSIPAVLPITGALMVVTFAAMSARYWELLPKIPALSHHHPLFLSWLLTSDMVQVLSTCWIWLFILCGVRNQPLFTWKALVSAEQARQKEDYDLARAQAHAQRLRPFGLLGEYLGGWRSTLTRKGFLTASGAWVGILILALALRLPHIDMNSAFMDESYYIDAGRRFLAEGVNVGIAKVMFGSYLYPLLTAVASLVGGLEGSRFLSHLLGAVTAVAVGQVGHRLAGHGVGIVSAVLAAIAYQAVYISALATYDAASVAGLATSLAFLVTALWGRAAADMPESSRLRWLLASSLALIFGILSKYVAVIFVPGMVAAIAFWSVLNKRFPHPAASPMPNEGVALASSLQTPAPASPSLTALLALRLGAFGLPIVLILGGYFLLNIEVFKEWWAFTQEYTSLSTSRRDELVEIYLVKGWNVLLAVAIAAGGWLVLTPRRAAHWIHTRWEHLAWGRIFLLAQATVFGVFHVVTRADINYAKHINYAFPFLFPLTSLGLMVGADWVRSGLQRHGIARAVAQWLGMVALCIPLLLLGLREVDVLKGALHWWPDLRPYAAALETGIRPSDKILVDDTGLVYYTLDHMAEGALQVDSPFYATAAGLTGIAAAQEGVKRQYYDVVILDGGITPEGVALHTAVAPLLYPAGYVRVYVSPESSPSAGMYVAPHALERFSNAEKVGQAWMNAWYIENKRDVP